MKENINKIKAIINTLEGLDIRPTYDNMNRLLGCMQVLNSICDDLEKQEVATDGNPDSE